MRKLVKRGILSKFNQVFRRLKPFNRRQDERFIPLHPLECVYTKVGQGGDFSVSVMDISKGGLLLATGEDKIYPSTEVEMRFQLPNCQEAIYICGKIVRTYRWKEIAQYFSGVKFLNREDQGIKLVLDFALDKAI